MEHLETKLTNNHQPRMVTNKEFENILRSQGQKTNIQNHESPFRVLKAARQLALPTVSVAIKPTPAQFPGSIVYDNTLALPRPPSAGSRSRHLAISRNCDKIDTTEMEPKSKSLMKKIFTSLSPQKSVIPKLDLSGLSAPIQCGKARDDLPQIKNSKSLPLPESQALCSPDEEKNLNLSGSPPSRGFFMKRGTPAPKTPPQPEQCQINASQQQTRMSPAANMATACVRSNLRSLACRSLSLNKTGNPLICVAPAELRSGSRVSTANTCEAQLDGAPKFKISRDSKSHSSNTTVGSSPASVGLRLAVKTPALGSQPAGPVRRSFSVNGSDELSTSRRHYVA